MAEFASGQWVVVLELMTPAYDAESGTLTYGADVLEGYEGENLTPVLADHVAERLLADFGPAALFIDSCWDLTVCWCWHREGRYYEMLGEIPIGHVSTHWSLLWWDCVIDGDDWDAAIASCWGSYQCGNYNNEQMTLGRSSGEWDGYRCYDGGCYLA